MALPWLIGAAVVALVAAASKSKDDDDGDDSSAREQEARRRAERERVENERKKKLSAAQGDFSSRGESMGNEIAQSLKDWIAVAVEKSPAFNVTLNSNGYEISRVSAGESNIQALLFENDPEFNEIHKNLKTYEHTYAVKVKKGPELEKASNELKEVDSELSQLKKIKQEIYELKKKISSDA